MGAQARPMKGPGCANLIRESERERRIVSRDTSARQRRGRRGGEGGRGRGGSKREKDASFPAGGERVRERRKKGREKWRERWREEKGAKEKDLISLPGSPLSPLPMLPPLLLRTLSLLLLLSLLLFLPLLSLPLAPFHRIVLNFEFKTQQEKKKSKGE